MNELDRITVTIISSIFAVFLLVITVVFLIFWVVSKRIRPRIFSQGKNRFSDTINSSISFLFNSPHLINNNVHNLDNFLTTQSTSTAKSWHYQQAEMWTASAIEHEPTLPTIVNLAESFKPNTNSQQPFTERTFHATQSKSKRLFNNNDDTAILY